MHVPAAYAYACLVHAYGRGSPRPSSAPQRAVHAPCAEPAHAVLSIFPLFQAPPPLPLGTMPETRTGLSSATWGPWPCGAAPSHVRLSFCLSFLFSVLKAFFHAREACQRAPGWPVLRRLCCVAWPAARWLHCPLAALPVGHPRPALTQVVLKAALKAVPCPLPLRKTNPAWAQPARLSFFTTATPAASRAPCAPPPSEGGKGFNSARQPGGGSGSLVLLSAVPVACALPRQADQCAS